jgi:hypothetical protein
MQKRKSNPVGSALVTGATLLALVSGPAPAADGPAKCPEEDAPARAAAVRRAAERRVTVTVVNRPPSGKPSVSPATAGMRAWIDPETGKLTDSPTEAQRAELAAREAEGGVRFRALAEPLFATYYPDGSVSVEVPPEMMDFAVASVGKDGKVLRTCVHGKDAAERSMKSGVPALEER